MSRLGGRHRTTDRARRIGPLPRDVVAILVEAGGEVSSACPWLPVGRTGRAVRTAWRLGLVGRTIDLFGITALGVLALRRIDRKLAHKALAGLRRNVAGGSVMPWDVVWDRPGMRPVLRTYAVEWPRGGRVWVRCDDPEEAVDEAYGKLDAAWGPRGASEDELWGARLVPVVRGPRAGARSRRKARRRAAGRTRTAA